MAPHRRQARPRGGRCLHPPRRGRNPRVLDLSPAGVALRVAVAPGLLGRWVDLKFVGFDNYAKLLTGIDHVHFLGLAGPMTPVGFLVLAGGYGLIAFGLYRYVRGEYHTAAGLVGRLLAAGVAGWLLWLVVSTVLSSGRPGTLVVTIIYVGVDVSVQFLLGLGLALLVVQQLPGRRFFRVVFLLPMMITPVGVAYLFRMLTDTDKGPLYPLWAHFGLIDVSWVTNPWVAR